MKWEPKYKLGTKVYISNYDEVLEKEILWIYLGDQYWNQVWKDTAIQFMYEVWKARSSKNNIAESKITTDKNVVLKRIIKTNETQKKKLDKIIAALEWQLI